MTESEASLTRHATRSLRCIKTLLTHMQSSHLSSSSRTCHEDTDSSPTRVHCRMERDIIKPYSVTHRHGCVRPSRNVGLPSNVLSRTRPGLGSKGLVNIPAHSLTESLTRRAEHFHDESSPDAMKPQPSHSQSACSVAIETLRCHGNHNPGIQPDQQHHRQDVLHQQEQDDSVDDVVELGVEKRPCAEPAVRAVSAHARRTYPNKPTVYYTLLCSNINIITQQPIFTFLLRAHTH